MDEATRQRYLSLLEVEQYVPRRELAGGPVLSVWRPEDSGAGQARARPNPAQGRAGAVLARTQSSPKIPAAPKPPPRPESSPVKAAGLDALHGQAAESGPQEQFEILLDYFHAGEGIAIVSEVPLQLKQEWTQPCRELVTNIVSAVLRAAGRRAPDTAVARQEQFRWPIEGFEGISSSAEAAKALHGFCRMKTKSDGFSALIVFASGQSEFIRDALARNSGKGQSLAESHLVVHTHSLPALLNCPPLKKETWDSLQPLIQHLGDPAG